MALAMAYKMVEVYMRVCWTSTGGYSVGLPLQVLLVLSSVHACLGLPMPSLNLH